MDLGLLDPFFDLLPNEATLKTSLFPQCCPFRILGTHGWAAFGGAARTLAFTLNTTYSLSLILQAQMPFSTEFEKRQSFALWDWVLFSLTTLEFSNLFDSKDPQRRTHFLIFWGVGSFLQVVVTIWPDQCTKQKFHSLSQLQDILKFSLRNLFP